MELSKPTSFVIFSGGSACNHILNAFQKIGENDVSYILAISDNGGSTSELLRVLGGPSVGDLRSRLIRLMDAVNNNETTEMSAIRELLKYRLPIDKNQQIAHDEWSLIVEGRHSLWNDISIEKKQVIRGYLTLFDLEILKRSHKHFNFCNGSIGNFFLTGIRLFTGSLEAAIFLFASIIGITTVPTSVVPVINTNQTATIAASLMNGETLVGQCEISHPSIQQNSACTPKKKRTNPIDAFSYFDNPNEVYNTNEIDSSSNLFFSKHMDEKLKSPVDRIYYINEFGQEVYPVPNPKVINQLSIKETLVYSIGSLYTSLIPCLVLRGVGNAIIQSHSLKSKILLLNGSNDRETSDYTALDFINAITMALNESQRIDARRAFYQSCDDIEERNDDIDNNNNNNDDDDDDVDDDDYIPGFSTSRHGSVASTVIHTPPSYSNLMMGNMCESPTSQYPPFPSNYFYPSSPSSFITHLVYLDNGAIQVDVAAIEALGIKCISVKGTLSSSFEPVYNETEITNIIQSICT